MGDPTPRHSVTAPTRLSLGQSLRAAVRSLKPQREDQRGEPPRRDPGNKHRRTRGLVLAGLLAGSAVTVGVLKLPEEAEPTTVSGAPRLKLTDSGEFVRWRTAATTLTIDPSFEQLGPGARDVVALAYSTWSSERAHLPALTIDMASSPRRAERDGVNLVTYAPIDIAGHTQSLGVTVAYLSADGTILEVDTIINSRKPFEVLADHVEQSPHHDHDHWRGDHWRGDHERDDDDDLGGHDHDHDHEGTPSGGAPGKCVQSYDLQSVLAHEAGHFLGLGEDQENREATMYFKTSRCDTRQRDLTDDDVAAVETTYAEPPPAEEGEVNQAAACAMAPGTRSRPAAWALCAVLMTAAGVRRFSGGRRGAQETPSACPSV